MQLTDSRLDRLAAGLGELLEAHREGGRDFKRWADDPVGFLTDGLHEKPWWRQTEVSEAVLEHHRVAIVSAHDMGKDFLMARLALWQVAARGGLAVLTAPTDRQCEILMRELRSAFRKARDLPGELYSRQLRIAGEPRVLAFTSSAVDNLTGWHDPRGVMVCISEGQGERVEDTAYDAAFALVTDEFSRLVAGGNPVRASGRFYEISKKASWHVITIPASDHPNVAAGRRVVPYGPAPDWPETIAQEYGETSAYYQSRVLAQFPEQDESSLIDREAWERADAPQDAERALRDLNNSQAWGGAPLAALGVDVAREGSDKTALALRWGTVLLDLVRWKEPDTVENARRIRDYVAGKIEEGIPLGLVVVDETSMGGGVFDNLRRLVRHLGWNQIVRGDPPRLRHQSVEVLGFKSSRRAPQPQRFVDLRAQSFWHAHDEIEGDALYVHPHVDRDLLAALGQELLAHDHRYEGDDRIRVLSKDDVRSRIGRSPDLCDALVMTYLDELEEGEDDRVFQIAKGNH